MRTALSLLVFAVTMVAGCRQVDHGPSMSPQEPVTLVESGGAAVSFVPDWVAQAKISDDLVCYLDIIDGARRDSDHWRASPGDSLRISGWAVERRATFVQRVALVELRGLAGGKHYFFNAVRTDRPDVNASVQFSDAKPSRAGLVSAMSLEGLSPGIYEIHYIVGDESLTKICTLGPKHRLVIE